ncbi:MAG: hypothetical protein F4Z04_17660 [Acidobacteria bacterium]|nr:hypothetical protein [Acidobacteriota bacterium]
MTVVVPRSCTEITDDESQRSDGRASRLLESYRENAAYVLLGDPGAGKSVAFETECAAHGSQACLVTARDFLTFDLSDHPEWGGKILFIDGLDEVRTGAHDVRTPFDAIRRKLDRLGTPRFRLSCREADWLGANDRANLSTVSPDTHVTVLRLDPLTDDDIELILESLVDDAGEFMAVAREKGVDGLLRNPQCLAMFAEVVGDGRGWPASRLDLFEAACRKLVREHNDEHLAATQSSPGAQVATPQPTEEALLDAAGRLCAVQLIAGIAGYAVTPVAADVAYPAVDECTPERDGTSAPVHDVGCRLGELRRVLATKLFSAHASGHFRPVHRHVAEFLGARYLARLIGGSSADRRNVGGGLPCGRILSLLTGHDGVVVTELRGLSAWIAAHSRFARSDLIERDPIGVGLYGDLHRFSAEEKRALLESLRVQASRLTSVFDATGPFSTLAGTGMEPVFREILTDPSRSDNHQEFVYFVLRILAKGKSMPGLSGILVDVVRDETRWPGVNRAGLDALIRSHSDGRQGTATLKELLVAVRSGRVRDPDDELLGTLLGCLYPDDLPPSEVWDHFFIPSEQELFGAYRSFWCWDLLDKCSDTEAAEHLDTLAAKLDELRPVMRDRVLEETPLALLARALHAHGSRIATRRLYDWLGVGLPATELHHPSTSEGARRIRDWLEQHAEIQKAVFAEGVKRCAATDNREWAVALHGVLRHLYGSTPPADFGAWCLDQAIAATDERVSRMYLERSLTALADRTGDEGLSLEVLFERTKGRLDLADIVNKLGRWPLDGHLELVARIRDKQPDQEKVERERREWIEHFRSQEAALRANRGSPALLHGIALAYFGIAVDAFGDDPMARLAGCLGNDRRLIEVALSAFRRAIHRDDLPDVAEIIRLDAQGKLHYLALPVLAGLAETDRAETEALSNLNDRQVGIALAFRTFGVSDGASMWYRRFLATRPDVVADVLVKCASARIRNGGKHVPGAYELAHDVRHADVARIACLPLLRAFPTRCTLKQLDALDELLWAAIQHADGRSLQDLIVEKLARKSMNHAQRARWLMCGVIVVPGRYEQQLWDFAHGRERRIRQVAAFMCPDHPGRFSYGGLGTSALQLLVSLLGSWCGPEDRSGAGSVTPVMDASRGVGSFIGELAARSNPEAGAALDALASDPALSRWRPRLIRARDEQQVVYRDAAYRHPDIGQVCRTLNDGSPANAGDLAALVKDRLDEIGVQIGNGNTNDWRQYWNEDPHGRPTEPKPENSCRDALLSDLRQHLPEDVDAQPEGHYANDKRADIRISCRDFQVPVEVKKDAHPALWSALQDQLVAQYVRDPETDGYGIYLVLCFGDDERGRLRTPPPPSGTSPRSPSELKERLEATLTRDEKRKIAVCVMDASPGGRGSTPSAP